MTTKFSLIRKDKVVGSITIDGSGIPLQAKLEQFDFTLVDMGETVGFAKITNEPQSDVWSNDGSRGLLESREWPGIFVKVERL